MEIKGDDLLFLFGAGASVDAGIPMSNAMVQRIEELIVQHEDWKPYRDLYYPKIRKQSQWQSQLQ